MYWPHCPRRSAGPRTICIARLTAAGMMLTFVPGSGSGRDVDLFAMATFVQSCSAVVGCRSCALQLRQSWLATRGATDLPWWTADGTVLNSGSPESGSAGGASGVVRRVAVRLDVTAVVLGAEVCLDRVVADLPRGKGFLRTVFVTAEGGEVTMSDGLPCS